ncbi:hypothetical protein KS4_26420 [Poriferisphaera corsica]|uniref:Type II secretion system protein GspC N-terminal domain-containing protein n=1 Tax=Poriferisphaera corsica TaxID=2528020 RepID=A0A517YWI8_9BACT|nr:hypothetical protein [Poriferisphaera corsica]QDU34572.1 hypothetical protein KS4_26420 [Poriferisphaera corsica]
MRLMPRQIRRGLHTLTGMCILGAITVSAVGVLLPLQKPESRTFVAVARSSNQSDRERLLTIDDISSLGQRPLQRPLYDPSSKVRQPPKLKLVGTSINGDSKQAFVVNKNGETVFVDLGDIVDGVTITIIEEDRIVLEYDEQQQTLTMESR